MNFPQLLDRVQTLGVRSIRAARRLPAIAMTGVLIAGVAGFARANELSDDQRRHLADVALGLHAGVDGEVTQYEEFGDWLRRKVLYRVVFSDLASWDTMASPWYLSATKRWLESDPRRVEVMSLPMLPKDATGDFDAITSGSRDAVFRSVATKLQNRGWGPRVIIRLGWEGNGDWYPWAYGKNPSGYRAAFRRIVHVMREIAPELRFEWCISSRTPRRDDAHWTEAYPGDDVVDIISMDVYDEWSSNTWSSLRDGYAGLRELREFAIEHGKPEAYPEWSCSTNVSANGGGDNPDFIRNMAEWFAGRPGGVLYHGYWNTTSAGPKGPVYAKKGTPVPEAATMFRQLFGGPAAPTEPDVR